MRSIFIIFISVSLSYGGILSFTTLDGEVRSISKGKSESPHRNLKGYSSIEIDDDHKIFTEDKSYYKVSEGTLIKKTDTQIADILIDKKKKDLLNRIDNLKEKDRVLCQRASEGFDVSEDTNTIRSEIDSIKTEYQSLP